MGARLKHMLRNEVVIGVGSNLDPDYHVGLARDVIQHRFEVVGESSFLRTEPVGFLDQPHFLNGAFLIRTELDSDSLKKVLVVLEKEIGRQPRNQKFGPREIDLDILVWNRIVVDADVYTRDFLKQSIEELYPGFEFRSE